jgi:hypothetical protein
VKRLFVFWMILASCGGDSSPRAGDPPPTCVDVANKVHANCVQLSDEPCDGSLYKDAYRACVEQTRTGRSVCVPNWNGCCSDEWVPADHITTSGQVDTQEEDR